MMKVGEFNDMAQAEEAGTLGGQGTRRTKRKPRLKLLGEKGFSTVCSHHYAASRHGSPRGSLLDHDPVLALYPDHARAL